MEIKEAILPRQRHRVRPGVLCDPGVGLDVFLPLLLLVGNHRLKPCCVYAVVPEDQKESRRDQRPSRDLFETRLLDRLPIQIREMIRLLDYGAADPRQWLIRDRFQITLRP